MEGSSTRTEPAAALRGFTKILPPLSSCWRFMASNALRVIRTSPRTSKLEGSLSFFRVARSTRSGTERIVFTLGVTSSPVRPSPRVTHRRRRHAQRDVFAGASIAASDAAREAAVDVLQRDAETIEFVLGDVFDFFAAAALAHTALEIRQGFIGKSVVQAEHGAS